MKKILFFGYVVLCAIGLVGTIDIHAQENLYNVIDFNDSDDDMHDHVPPTDEEVDAILMYLMQLSTARYETQDIIGQGEGVNALNPVNPDSSNRSRAGSFAGEVVNHHQQILALPFVMPLVINEDDQIMQVGGMENYDNYYDSDGNMLG